MVPPDSNAPPGQASDEEAIGARTLVGKLVAERYQVLELLGEGGMGAVYRAQHIHMQKDVALKVLHSSMSVNPEVVKRFEREAVAAAKVVHPNVAGASDFGRLPDGSFYLVLEYVRGQSLGDLIEQTGAMPAERACRIAIQIAAALAAAHDLGIVHRDLKPENVMLPSGDFEGDIVKVLDFGMAKMTQHEDTKATKLTMHGAVYGTPAYMAPEQAAGNDVDHRADLYALGLMLYEMVAGRPPFFADQVMALLVKQMTEIPPPLPNSVPKEVARITMKLLEKAPESRHPTAEAVLQDLTAFLGISYQNPHLSAVGLTSPWNASPRASAPSVGDQIATRLSRVAPLVDKAKEKTAPAVEFLKEPMTVQGKTFPRFIPVMGVLVVASALAVFLLSGSDEVEPVAASGVAKEGSSQGPEASNAAAKDPDPPNPELAKVIVAAEQGSDPALYALEQRKDEDRSLTEWMGLAKARLMRKNIEPALDAYRAAIEMDESMRRDDVMLGALRRLADDDEFAEEVLDFAADELGPLGADMLFHVWSKTSQKTKSTTIAYDKLTSSGVEKNYSPSLAIAMNLRDVKDDCQKSLALMPKVEAHGDQRVMNVLRDMHKNRGCGETKRDDCYPCMRKGAGEDALDAATQAAAMRAAPLFELQRFRFKK